MISSLPGGLNDTLIKFSCQWLHPTRSLPSSHCCLNKLSVFGELAMPVNRRSGTCRVNWFWGPDIFPMFIPNSVCNFYCKYGILCRHVSPVNNLLTGTFWSKIVQTINVNFVSLFDHALIIFRFCKYQPFFVISLGVIMKNV